MSFMRGMRDARSVLSTLDLARNKERFTHPIVVKVIILGKQYVKKLDGILDLPESEC